MSSCLKPKEQTEANPIVLLHGFDSGDTRFRCWSTLDWKHGQLISLYVVSFPGTPSADTISGVRNEKARKYLTSMRKKNPVPFTEKFPGADPHPKDRPTAEEALSDPYFKGLAKIEREPSCRPISNLEFEFERRRVTKEDIKELIFRETKGNKAGNDSTNFLHPSVGSTRES